MRQNRGSRMTSQNLTAFQLALNVREVNFHLVEAMLTCVSKQPEPRVNTMAPLSDGEGRLQLRWVPGLGHLHGHQEGFHSPDSLPAPRGLTQHICLGAICMEYLYPRYSEAQCPECQLSGLSWL